LLLAHASKEVLEAVLASDRTRFTAETLVDRKELEKALEAARENGYASSQGERDPEVASLATAMRDHTGCVVAVLGISTVKSRLTGSRRKSYLQALQQHALQISSALGFRDR
jgi:DNA-binding IclR family transcriptional regulator